jgi:hypothetical protein
MMTRQIPSETFCRRVLAYTTRCFLELRCEVLGSSPGATDSKCGQRSTRIREMYTVSFFSRPILNRRHLLSREV